MPSSEANAWPDSRTDSSAPMVVGWREWLQLPEIGVAGIKAKVDTGARTSALHTHDYEVYQREGVDWVRFHLHPLPRSRDIELSCEAQVLAFREVKDSGGHAEHRPFILTTAKLGAFEWPIELSLTNRESMRFRMLLGRTSLVPHFLVDPRRSYLLGKRPRRLYARFSGREGKAGD